MKPNDQITLVENLVATSQRVEEVKQASDEEVVRRKFPLAYCDQWSDDPHVAGYCVARDQTEDATILGFGDTDEIAWRDAHSHLQADAPPVDIILVLGNWYYLDTGYRTDGSVMSYVKEAK